jgi:hypothetical protein
VTSPVQPGNAGVAQSLPRYRRDPIGDDHDRRGAGSLLGLGKERGVALPDDAHLLHNDVRGTDTNPTVP